MEFLNCLWLDAERGIGKTQLQTKMSKTRSFLKHFLRKFNTPGGSFSVLISNVFGAGRYYLVVRGAGKARFNVATSTNATVTCTAYIIPYNLQTKSI